MLLWLSPPHLIICDSTFICLLQSTHATELWLKYEHLMHPLSQLLCEELKLVLQPTSANHLKWAPASAIYMYLFINNYYILWTRVWFSLHLSKFPNDATTKISSLPVQRNLYWLLCITSWLCCNMWYQICSHLCEYCRGDFRSGKRLNLRRIIPYIASNYQSDRIWLRRVKPSKREYQILVAVDDSSSMKENGCDQVSVVDLLFCLPTTMWTATGDCNWILSLFA